MSLTFITCAFIFLHQGKSCGICQLKTGKEKRRTLSCYIKFENAEVLVINDKFIECYLLSFIVYLTFINKCRYNTSRTGYDLDDSSLRIGVLSPLRSFSSSALCIMRAIMHSAFIWFASSIHESRIPDLAKLLKVQPESIDMFFWNHLQKDIEQLSLATERSIDEASVIVHLVLKEILTKKEPQFG